MKILLCGCGALGSQIALHLARPELEFVLVDDDRVEEGNIGTSVYGHQHVGMQKVKALAGILWQKCRCRARAHKKTFTDEAVNWVSNISPYLILTSELAISTETSALKESINAATVEVNFLISAAVNFRLAKRPMRSTSDLLNFDLAILNSYLNSIAWFKFFLHNH